MILSAAIKKQCHAVVVVLATTTLLLLLALGCSSTNAFVPVVVVPSRPQPRLASNNWVGGKPTYYHLEQQLQECRIPFARDCALAVSSSSTSPSSAETDSSSGSNSERRPPRTSNGSSNNNNSSNNNYAQRGRGGNYNNNYSRSNGSSSSSSGGGGPQQRPQQRQPPQSGRGRVVGSGGGGGPPTSAAGPVLKLQNPLLIHRVVEQTPAATNEILYAERRESNNNNNNSRGPPPPRRGGGGPGGNASTSTRPGGRVKGTSSIASDGPAPEKDFGRSNRRGPAPKAGFRPGGKTTNDSDDKARTKRKTSLRITSGRRGSELTQRRGSLRKRDRTAQREAKLEAALERRTVYLPDGSLTVSQLAEIIDEKPIGVIKFLMTDLGVMASMTQSLDPSTCVAVAEGFGMIVGGADDMDDDLYDEESALATGVVFDEEDDPEFLQPRAPVVTIMGHVDHGKTSLLDAIRSTDVTAGEAGGITQHIAAYQVTHNGKPITFIDTPGHAAFTDMRERGANITDMVILVVAADDGVKQQTADSIMCARQAGVPLIVAINKCDKEAADPIRVQTELTQYEILTEEFGGDVLSSQISAKEKTNLDDLLDKIMLQAEIEDLKANPDRDAEGIVIEAYVEKGLGTVATTLIKRGTLRIGDVFVTGATYGKVRALLSTTDNSRMQSAGPSTPVRVVGFEGVPAAGDILIVAKDEHTAREMAENRQRIARESSSSSYQSGLMASVSSVFGASKQSREMCVVVKADVQGSAEALTRALRELKLENEEAVVTVKVLVSETGEVSKSDIAIASVTPDTTVIAFNVASSMAAMDDARAAGVSIEYYNIIYDAIESVESRMQEVLSPTPAGEYAGSAVVQEVFNIGGTGNIAGSRCKDGMLKKGSNVRVMRGDKILIETKIKTLRNFKSETDTIEEGNECGIGLLDFEDFQVGDVVECYVLK